MISVDVSGVKELCKELDSLSKRLDFRVRLAVEALLQEGYYIASYGFPRALYSGHNDVQVIAPYWDGDTMILRADGDAVAFIEFGTGTNYYDYPDESVYRKLHMSRHGGYGKHHGQQPRWWYEGEPGNNGRPKRHKDGTYDERWSTSWGDPPARVMYDASKVLDREHVVEVVRRAFQ